MQIKTGKTSWDLSPLLESDQDVKIQESRKEAKKSSENFINKWKNRSDYLENPKILKEALDEYAKIKAHSVSGDDGAGTIEAYYFWLRTQQDQNSPELKAKYNQATDFANKLINQLRFFPLKISKINLEKQNRFLQNNSLAMYRHYLERLFERAKHTLTETEETILNLKSKTSNENWAKMLSGFLSKEEREVITEPGKIETKNFSEIQSLLNNKNKRTRDSAAKAFNSILEKHSDVAESEINSILEDKKTDDELRKFPRPDSSRHLADDIDSKIVDSLISSVSSSFNTSKKYYELKAKLLGLKKLAYHERNIPYGKIEKKYSYEDSIALANKVFSNLDSEFSEILKNFVEKGFIDVFPKKGKRSGAFCSDNLIFQPTYIMLNHTNRLDDVLTLAHEVGHGINSELMKKRQNPLTFGTVLSTAEVASTFMEDFILQELIKNADEELKLGLMMQKLNNDIATIFRQSACYQFEHTLHNEFRKKGYLSKREIGEIFQKHMFSYLGEAVEQSSGSENWWIHWSHIRNCFYVYSYSSGLLISKALQTKVKKDKKFIKEVKEFLSTGLSASPKETFLKLGINISTEQFWNEGLKEVALLLKDTESLATKLEKF